MIAQPVTINLPPSLYEYLRVRADQHQRSIADEVLDLLAMAVPVADDLPDDIQHAVSPLTLLDDAALWHAAQTRLSAEAAERLEELHHKRQRDGLTASEVQECAALMRQYERSMLVRAQAAALLKERGHDIAILCHQPATPHTGQVDEARQDNTAKAIVDMPASHYILCNNSNRGARA